MGSFLALAGKNEATVGTEASMIHRALLERLHRMPRARDSSVSQLPRLLGSASKGLTGWTCGGRVRCRGFEAESASAEQAKPAAKLME